jgi:hypothetical protein
MRTNLLSAGAGEAVVDSNPGFTNELFAPTVLSGSAGEERYGQDACSPISDDLYEIDTRDSSGTSHAR